MDWVRGRPPDALLFLKAAVKVASSGLSLSCRTGKPSSSPSLISSAQASSRVAAAATAAAAAAATSSSDGGGRTGSPGIVTREHHTPQEEEEQDEEGSRTADKPSRTAEKSDSIMMVTPSATNPSPAAGRNDALTAATPSAPDPVGVAAGAPLAAPNGSRGIETPRMMASEEFMPGGVAGIMVSESRALAEGVLLGPLRDVGTVAGALRSRVGGGLREMAAAR